MGLLLSKLFVLHITIKVMAYILQSRACLEKDLREGQLVGGWGMLKAARRQILDRRVNFSFFLYIV